jgi:hypothetical protein
MWNGLGGIKKGGLFCCCVAAFGNELERKVQRNLLANNEKHLHAGGGDTSLESVSWSKGRELRGSCHQNPESPQK